MLPVSISLLDNSACSDLQRNFILSGNYVATLEGKQTFQKSDVLIARVYTNWDADFVVNECKKSTKFVKRFMRARIAGVVTPSSTKSDEDYLDMIEIPVSYSTATIITCCQVCSLIENYHHDIPSFGKINADIFRKLDAC